MKPKRILLLLPFIGLAGSAYAQPSIGTYWVRTDPVVSTTWPVSNRPSTTDKPGYTLIWEDDFNYSTNATTQLSAKWNRENGCAPWSPHHGNLGTFLNEDAYNPSTSSAYGTGSSGIKGWELQGDPSTPGNKILKMRAIRQTRPAGLICDDVPTDGVDNPAVGGGTRAFTVPGMSANRVFKYGYIEFRAKMPSGGGVGTTIGSFLPAFWLFRHPSYDMEGKGLEIDLLEMWTHCPRQWLTNSISYNNPCYDPNFGPWEQSLDQTTGLPTGTWGQSKGINLANGDAATFSNRFWTYGVEWDNEQLYFYLNGVLVRKIRGDCQVARCFSTLIVNIAAELSNTPCTPDQVTNVAEMEVDYIRVYKRILNGNFGSNPDVGGWDAAKHPRMLADVDGDGRADLVGFGESRVFVARSNEGTRGFEFQTATPSFANLCFTQGWTIDKYPVMTGDVNGDGRQDIVGFGGSGVFLARANGSIGTASFVSPTMVLNNFGYDLSAGGWRVDQHPRMLADVNGDGKDDVVGFGGAGVYVALGTGTSSSAGFGPVTLWSNQFGYDASAGGWRVNLHKRMMADMNNDGKADVVGVSNSGTWVAIANAAGTGFLPPANWCPSLSGTAGYTAASSFLGIGDVNYDGLNDIVAGNSSGAVSVAINTGTSLGLSFSFNTSGTAVSYAMDKPFVGDFTGDGRADLILFGTQGTYLAEAFSGSGGTGLLSPRVWYEEFGPNSPEGAWLTTTHVKLMGDVNNDGVQDLMGCGQKGVFGHESPKCAYWDPYTFPLACGTYYNFDNCSLMYDPKTCIKGSYNPGASAKSGALNEEEVTSSAAIAISPNPSSGEMTVSYHNGSSGLMNYEIRDLNGKLVASDVLQVPGQVDLHSLPNGVYFFLGHSGNDFHKEKIVIQR